MPHNEVTMTAQDVAKFFAALDPDLEVYVSDECFEDANLSQWYAYRFRFSVTGAERWIYEAEKFIERLEHFRQFTSAANPRRPTGKTEDAGDSSDRPF